MEIPFKGISRFLNICVLTATARVLPKGFDVSSDAPNDFEGLKDHFKRTGRVLVSNEASDHTIYGDNEVNYAFRAWHDYHHLTMNKDFSPASEVDVVLKQCDDLHIIYGHSARIEEIIKFIVADGIGQVEYFTQYSSFPHDQKAFVLAYIQDRSASLKRIF